MTLTITESFTAYKNKNRCSHYVVYFYRGWEFARQRMSQKNWEKLILEYAGEPENFTYVRDLEFIKKTKPFYCTKTGKLAQSWIFDYKTDPNYFPKSIFDGLPAEGKRSVIETFGEDMIEKADGSHMKAGVWR